MKIGALVLAAGFSNRFGSVKLCAQLENGETIFQQTVNRLSAAIPHIEIATRKEVAPLIEDFATNIRVFNDAEKGMGSTLAYGIQYFKGFDGCLVCLADMPFIEPRTYAHLAGKLRRDNIIIPTFDDKPGNPVGFGVNFLPELSALSGNQGGRTLMEKHAKNVIRVPVDDPAILYDIDTQEDLAQLARKFSTTN
jgi:molybdenum cofactor cytidylyltransferase